VPELELLVGGGGLQGFRGSGAKEPVHEEKSGRVYVSISGERERNDFSDRDRSMGINKLRDLILISAVNVFAEASSVRMINLSLNVVNEPRAIRAVELVQHSVTSHAAEGAIGDSMIALDFALVEVVSLRHDTKIRGSIAADVVLHTPYSRVANCMMNRCKWAGISLIASQHMETTTVTHSAARTAVALKNGPECAKGKRESEDVIAGRAAVGDVTNRGVEGERSEGIVAANKPSSQLW